MQKKKKNPESVSKTPCKTLIYTQTLRTAVSFCFSLHAPSTPISIQFPALSGSRDFPDFPAIPWCPEIHLFLWED